MDKYSKYKWNQNEFDALVSFAYNIGSIDGLTSSGSRSKDEIVDKFLAYNRAGGKILSGLTRRRQEERALFITSVHKEGWVKRMIAGVSMITPGNIFRNDWHQDGDK